MSKATVVFANGSKTMAHNLDDQYQRWMLRREEAPPEKASDPEIGIEEFVPDLPDELSSLEIIDLKQILIEKKVYLAQVARDLDANRYDYGKREYHYRRASIGIAGQKIQAQQSVLKNYGKDFARHAVISRMKQGEEAGTLSTDELMELAVLRFEDRSASLAGVEAQVNKTDDPDLREQKQRNYIDDLKNQIIALQGKLLEAYERIINLQGG